MTYFYAWRPYVSVAKRRANAAREMGKLQKKGKRIKPIEIEGRKIARTFWGNAWCDHLEKFSDYANRLPRGRTYVRNGSVCHLDITEGKIEAIVSGSKLYNVTIRIKSLAPKKWKTLRQQCVGQIGSMLELLQGRFSNHVMQIVTDCDNGLFPQPREIRFSCDCPDWAVMCKHVAAALYGISARLDHQPELLFLLRNVDHEELIGAEIDMYTATTGKGKRRRLTGQDLSSVFGVEIDMTAPKSARKKRSAAVSMAKGPEPEKASKKGAVRIRSGPTTTRSGNNARPSKSTKPANKAEFTPTATKITRLRKQFGLNRAQFAKLLGVSQPTVANWENSKGKLNLRQHTIEALTWAARLTSDQVTRKLRRMR